MSKPLISIIIPVYNVEKYLRRCLDSVIAQTYTEWECLLIDDGSTDSSGAVCDEYAEKDSRFRVFHKENGGVSTARNLGIKESLGEWIYFSDSDDWLYSHCLETLFSNVGDKYDSVMAGYERIENNQIVVSPTKVVVESRSVNEALLDYCNSRYRIFGGYLWNRLFKSSIIKKNNLYFDSQIYCKEDGLFIVSYLSCCKGLLKFTSTPVYKYFYRKNGSMGSMLGRMDDKYITNLDARIRMYAIVRDRFPHDLRLIIVFLQEIARFICKAYPNYGFFSLIKKIWKSLDLKDFIVVVLLIIRINIKS